MRLLADDDIKRIRAVWLGPTGWTLPFAARYSAWGLWFGMFMACILIAWFVPGLNVSSTTLIWGGCLSALGTTAAMSLVDHERPLQAAMRTLLADLRTIEPGDPTEVTYAPSTRKVRVRTTSRPEA